MCLSKTKTISVIGKHLDMKADRIIDASGKLVMPGGIDPHGHLDMPFMGHIQRRLCTGTAAHCTAARRW